MRKLAIFLGSIILSSMAMANDYNSMYSQESLKNQLERFPRCKLEAPADLDLKTDYSIIVPTDASNGENVYFLEVKEGSKDSQIIQLKKTHLNLLGYRVEAKVGLLNKVEGSVVLNRNNTEFFLNLKSWVPGVSSIELYKICE